MSLRLGSLATLFALVLATGCSGAVDETGAPRAAQTVSNSRQSIARALDSALRAPRVPGRGSIAPRPPEGSAPTREPARAGPSLRGHPLPTNQWWTSALVGPWTEPLHAGPVATKVEPAGVQVGYSPPAAEPDHVIQPFVPSVAVGGPLADVEVVGYGAFHVVLESRVTGGGSVRTTVAQGNPVVTVRFRGVDEPRVLLEGLGGPVTMDGGVVRATLGGREWVVAAAAGDWRRSGSALLLVGAPRSVVVAVGPAPTGAGATWREAVSRAAASPVLDTEETLSYDAARATVRQVLTVRREGGASGAWALTPLQRRHRAEPGGERGEYATSTGPMRVVDARSVAIEVSEPGFLPGVPRVRLSNAVRSDVLDDLRSDLARPPTPGGSYFGAKETARIAGVVDVARAVGDRTASRRARSRLRAELVDWLTYSGAGDGRYVAYDPVWGGLVVVPAEFGEHDYNDHHFQFGYLVRSAATLAEADPAFVRQYGAVVDALVRDYAGGGAGGVGFPSERVWNAGVGHSWASGYALFADGNNQESSSEAVAAWAAVARWGLAAGRERLARLGIARYALEAAAARTYWLGEGRVLPRGYAHRVVGIVWGGKIDHATFFSPSPAAIHGIQLLPLGFDGLYRRDPREARARITELLRASRGEALQWSNLFAAEAALYDPHAARRLLETSPETREPSTGAALARYLVEVLAVTGPPAADVVADGPFGLALRRAGSYRLLTVNPTSDAQTVVFRRNGKVVARVRVPPRGSVGVTRPVAGR